MYDEALANVITKLRTMETKVVEQEEEIESLRAQLKEKDAELQELRGRLAEAEKYRQDAERLRGLRELCGYVQDGSDTSVNISQDDATRNWHLSLGPLKIGQKWWYADTFNGVIDAAIAKGEE